MDRIDLIQDTGRWRAVVNVAMNLRVPQTAGGTSQLAEKLFVSQGGLWSVGLVSQLMYKL